MRNNISNNTNIYFLNIFQVYIISKSENLYKKMTFKIKAIKAKSDHYSDGFFYLYVHIDMEIKLNHF